jgi:hypothetical protein
MCVLAGGVPTRRDKAGTHETERQKGGSTVNRGAAPPHGPQM